MKRLLLVLILVLSTNLVLSVSDPYLNGSKFMSRTEAEKKFGTQKFAAEKFRMGSIDDRGKMAVSLLDSRNYIGKMPDEIKKDLGPFDGHFWNDGIPAYLLNEGWKTKTDTWQLVFLLNREGRVAELKIHRNCCSK